MRSLSPKSCFPLPSAQSQALAFHDPVGGSWGAFFTAHVSTVPVSDRCLILGHRTQRLNTQHARATPTLCGFARCRCCCFRVRKKPCGPCCPPTTGLCPRHLFVILSQNRPCCSAPLTRGLWETFGQEAIQRSPVAAPLRKPFFSF